MVSRAPTQAPQLGQLRAAAAKPFQLLRSVVQPQFAKKRACARITGSRALKESTAMEDCEKLVSAASSAPGRIVSRQIEAVAHRESDSPAAMIMALRLISRPLARMCAQSPYQPTPTERRHNLLCTSGRAPPKIDSFRCRTLRVPASLVLAI